MATISNRSLIGPEATFHIAETSSATPTDRSTWIMEVTYDVTPNTVDDTPLNHTDTKMIHLDRTTTGRIVWRTQTAAMDFVNEWLTELNEEKYIHVREEGDGSGKPNVKLDVILTGGSKTVQRDAMQTVETPFHANAITISTQ